APRWYIGGYAMVLQELVSAVLLQAWPRRFGARPADGAALAEALGGLIKAALLDMDLALTVYIEAAEEAGKRAEEQATAEAQNFVVERFGAALARLAQGDLTYRIEGEMPPAFAKLKDDFNRAGEQLGAALATVVSAATALDQASQE